MGKGNSCVVREHLDEDKRYARKKYVTLKEGVDLYSIGITRLRQIAEDAGAVRKIGGKVLINTECFDEYIESFSTEGN